MLINVNTLLPWNHKDRLDGILYPSNIEKLWSVEELAVIGLVKEVPFLVPAGYRTTGPSTWDQNGVETRPVELIPLPTPEEIEAQKTAQLDGIFGDQAIIKLLYYLGQEQGMFNSLEAMRAWVDAKEDPPATAGGKP